MGDSAEPTSPSDKRPASWRLQDAKARFSEVVRRAGTEGPQRVTVHGRDAVVVVAAADFDRDRRRHTGQRLVDMMAGSPLGEVDFDRPFIDGPVRDVDLRGDFSSTPTSSRNCADRPPTRLSAGSSPRSSRIPCSSPR